MTQDHAFDKDYWDQHWEHDRPRAAAAPPANPYLIRETSDLVPGTALDAGCGEGAEAIWLASRGWHVTAADIAAEALARAAYRAAQTPASGLVRWVEADLTTWAPGTQYDLVTTNYAHPAMPQLAFYQRIAEWVAPSWEIVTVEEHSRTLDGHDGRAIQLRDAVVRATRLAQRPTR